MTAATALTMLAWTLAFVACYALVSAYLVRKLWIYYLAVMALAREEQAGRLVGLPRDMGMTVLGEGYLLDFVVNVFVMTWVLWEWPGETTVSARLKRHNQTSTGWRKRVALFFEPFLDPYDPTGDHI